MVRAVTFKARRLQIDTRRRQPFSSFETFYDILQGHWASPNISALCPPHLVILYGLVSLTIDPFAQVIMQQCNGELSCYSVMHYQGAP